MDSNPLAQIWRASANGRTLRRKDVENFAIEQAAKLARDADLSLRAEGHFMYGLSQIWGARTSLLLQDSIATDENIGSAFREYLEAASQNAASATTSRSSQLLDFDLDELSIPRSLLSDSSSQAFSAKADSQDMDADMSIDDIIRGNDEVDAVTRSLEEQQRLSENIDFDLGEDLPVSGGIDAGDMPGPLDFGSEMEYSSSPPHTPPGNMSLDVQIDDAEGTRTAVIPQTKRRKTSTAIDAVITITRSNRPSAQILRALPEAPLTLTPLVPHYSDFWGIDVEDERVLDPQAVYDEMKRRRRVDNAEAEDHADHSAEEDDAMLSDYAANEDFSLGVDFDVEEEFTEEMLEAEQREAKRVIRLQLGHRGERRMFDDLATTAAGRASMLMEVLAMSSKGKLMAEQAAPFGAISLTRK